MNYTSVHGLKLLTFDTNSEKVTIVNEKLTGRSPVKFLREHKNKKDFVDIGHKDNKHLIKETDGTNDKKILKCNQFSQPFNAINRNVGKVNTQKKRVDDRKRKEDNYCKERCSIFQKQPQGTTTQMTSVARRVRDELIQIDQSGDSKQFYKTLNCTNNEIKDVDKPKSEAGDTLIETSRSQVVDLRKSFQDFIFYRDGKLLKENEKDKSVLRCQKERGQEVVAIKPEKKTPNTLKIRKSSSSIRRLRQKKISFNRLKSNISLHCYSNNNLIKDSMKLRKSLFSKSDEFITSNQEQQCSSDSTKIRHFRRRSTSDDWFGFRKSSKTDNQVLFCSRKCRESKAKNLRACRSLEHSSIIARSQDQMKCDDKQSYRMLSLPRISKTCVTKEKKRLYVKRNENTGHSAKRNLSATQQICHHFECSNQLWSSKIAKSCYILTESIIIVLLRYCLVCLILIIWLPCTVIISLYWLITYSMRPKCKKNDKLSASFIKWTNCYNSKVLEVLKHLLKPKESCNEPYQGQCQNIRSPIPNPQRQYTLAYSSIRGWLMKPLPQKQKHRSILKSNKKGNCKKFKRAKCPYKCNEKKAESKNFKRVKCPNSCNEKKIEGHPRLRWSLKTQDAEAGVSFQLEKRLQPEPIRKLETVNKTICDCPNMRQQSEYYLRTCPCSPQESRKLLAKNVKCQCSPHSHGEEKCATVNKTTNCPPLDPHGECYMRPSPYYSLHESKKGVSTTILRNDCQSQLHLERKEKCHTSEFTPKRKLVNKANKSTCFSPTLDLKCENYERISLCSSPQESRKALYKNVKCECSTSYSQGEGKCRATSKSAPKRNVQTKKSICYCPTLNPREVKCYRRPCPCYFPQESRKLLPKNIKCEFPPSKAHCEENCPAELAPKRQCHTVNKSASKICPTLDPQGECERSSRCFPQESRKLLPKNVICECPSSNECAHKASLEVSTECPEKDTCCTKQSFIKKCYCVGKDNFAAYCKFEEEIFTPRLRCDELYIQTLRNKPCFFCHTCCPQFYPFMLNVCRLCQNCCYTVLCTCAACLWMPWLCCCFLCSKLFCSCF